MAASAALRISGSPTGGGGIGVSSSPRRIVGAPDSLPVVWPAGGGVIAPTPLPADCAGAACSGTCAERSRSASAGLPRTSFVPPPPRAAPPSPRRGRLFRHLCRTFPLRIRRLAAHQFRPPRIVRVRLGRRRRHFRCGLRDRHIRGLASCRIAFWRLAFYRLRCPAFARLRARGSSRGLLRSEEHTSELQSLRHLVCRLL